MEEEDLLARLDRAEAIACIAAGRTKALEYGLRFFIATHPFPEEAARSWQQALALISEEHSEGPEELPNVEMYQAGIQQVLSALTRQFDVNSEPQEDRD